MLPVTITSGKTTQEYLLYLPPFAQLSKLKAGATTRRYQDVPLTKVLEDISSRAGLIIMAEAPPDIKVTADISLTSPFTAVQTVAKFAGYTVQAPMKTEVNVIYTLSLNK